MGKEIDIELRKIRQLQRNKRQSWLKDDDADSDQDADEVLPASSQAVPGRVEIEWVPETEPEKERLVPGRLDIRWPLTEEQERHLREVGKLDVVWEEKVTILQTRETEKMEEEKMRRVEEARK